MQMKAKRSMDKNTEDSDLYEESDSSDDRDDSFDNSIKLRSGTSLSSNENKSPKNIEKNIREKNKLQSNTNKSDNQYFSLKNVVLYTLIVLCAYLSWKFLHFVQSTTIKTCHFDSILNEANSICKQQPPETCNIIMNGIKTAEKYAEKTQIFVLLAQHEQREIAECLALTIANASSCAMSTKKGLIITPSAFLDNIDENILGFKHLITEYRAIVFKDLLKVNVPALTSLHYFLDTNNPLVKPAIYTITIIIDEPVDYNNRKNTINTVNAILMKKFKGYMDDNKIMPLITRITDGPILVVLPEKSEKYKCSLTQDKFVVY